MPVVDKRYPTASLFKSQATSLADLRKMTTGYLLTPPGHGAQLLTI